MKIKYIIICFLLHSVVQSDCYAQSSIKGKVYSSIDTPLEFASVSLFSEDSIYINGTLTDSLGNFSFNDISSGRYFVEINSIAYKAYSSDVFSVIINSTEFILPPIYVKESSILVEEIVVKSNRIEIVQKGDKIVMNLNEKNSSVDLSALEILKKTPSVDVNEISNEILLNGKKDVTILLNSKEIRLPADAVNQFLKSINSTNIASIEIITNPSSKYSSEGLGGVINIKLKDNSVIGTNGNVFSNIGYGKREKYGFGGNFNLKRKYLHLNFSLQQNQNNTEEVWDFYKLIEFENLKRTTNSLSLRNPNINTFNTSLFLESTFGANQIGVSILNQRRTWKMNAENSASIRVENNEENIKITDTEVDKWNSYLNNFYYSRQIREKHRLNFSTDFLYYKNENNHNYLNRFFENDNFINNEEIIIDKDTPIKIFVANLSFEKSNDNDSINYSIGLKASNSSLSNNVFTYEKTNNQLLLIDEFTENVSLVERNYAGFANYKIQLKRFTFQGGIRYEIIKSDLYDKIDEVDLLVLNNDNLFPNLEISYAKSADTKVSFFYNKRILRPKFKDIAPFVVFLDPYTFFTGNTSLKPSLVNSFKLFLQHKRNNFSLEYSDQKTPIIGFQPTIEPDNNIQTITALNFDHFFLLNGTYFRSWSFNNLQFDISTSLRFQGLKNTYSFDRKVEYDELYGKIGGNISYTTKKNLSLNVSGYYQSPFYYGLERRNAPGQINLLIKKKFSDYITCSFNISDVFNTGDWLLNSDWSQIYLVTDKKYDFETRVFQLSLNFQLGKSSIKKINPMSSSEDEKQRVN